MGWLTAVLAPGLVSAQITFIVASRIFGETVDIVPERQAVRPGFGWAARKIPAAAAGRFTYEGELNVLRARLEAGSC